MPISMQITESVLITLDPVLFFFFLLIQIKFDIFRLKCLLVELPAWGL